MQGGTLAEEGEADRANRNPNPGLFHRKVYGNPRLGHAPQQMRLSCINEISKIDRIGTIGTLLSYSVYFASREQLHHVSIK